MNYSTENVLRDKYLNQIDRLIAFADQICSTKRQDHPLFHATVNEGLIAQWRSASLSVLEDAFGSDSTLYKDFDKHVVHGKFAYEVEKGNGVLFAAKFKINSELPVASKENVSPTSKKVFIGHGRSQYWRELKDFLTGKLNLEYLEFNSEPVAGRHTADRLNEMLSECGFAFLIMSAEDEQVDGSFSARNNVIHEVGLFQGKLGMNKAIIILEEGCNIFSNIHGLTVIPFKDKISNCFEDIRDVLKREKFI
jgi:predicted nucleotide-binding protein